MVVRELPKIRFEGADWFVDDRLKQVRLVEVPWVQIEFETHDYFDMFIWLIEHGELVEAREYVDAMVEEGSATETGEKLA